MLFRRNEPASQPSRWQRLKQKLAAVADMPAGETPTFRKLFLWPSVTILAVLLLAAAVGLMALDGLTHRVVYIFALASLTSAGVVALLVLLLRLRAQLLKPISQLRKWASRVHSGRYTARIPENMQGGFAQLAHDLNDLGDELRSLNLEMAARVRRDTQHLARKTRSLEILYDVASSLSKSRTLEELLENFLDTFVQLFDARAAMVRLVTENGQLRLVASRGLDPQVIEREKFMPLDRCLCGQTAAGGTVHIQKGATACAAILGMPLLRDDCHELVAVPIQYHDQTLGVYNLVLDKPVSDFGDDLSDLLTSIGRHLGMAV